MDFDDVADGHWFRQLIAEAELNTAEDEELLELARDLVNEDSETRVAAIEELRDMVYERGECTPRRMDDAFLLRFLRARRFVVRRAHRLLVRYCKFLEQCPEMYLGVNLWSLGTLGRAMEGINVDCPQVGRISILRFGFWNPSEISTEHFLRTVLVMCEILVRLPKFQVLGYTMILDLEGVSMRHVSTLTPTVVHRMMCLFGYAMPVRVRSFHFINHTWTYRSFIYMFQRYAGGQTKVFVHNDIQSLQEHFPLNCLPRSYGGTCRDYNYSTVDHWLEEYRIFRDESFERDMKEMGYVLND